MVGVNIGENQEMRKQSKPYVAIAGEALAAVGKYKPDTLVQLEADQLAQDAILFRLQQLGSNLAHIQSLGNASLQRRFEPTWEQLIGFRDQILHDYDSISPTQIWTILDAVLDVERSLSMLGQP